MTAITLYDPKQLAEQISNQQNTIRILAGLVGNSDIVPVMRDDVHFGKIPGTDKPTLLKPGAELLCRTFGLYADYESMTQIEDFGGDGKEPLFYYRYKCVLRRIEDSAIVATGIGSCNSRESKYGYRWIPEHEVPPNLDKSRLNTRVDSIEEFDFAIDKAETTGKYGKSAEYWQEFKDAIANGTAEKFKKSTKGGKQFDAYRITSVTYQVPNPEIASQVNTIDKMAQKRSLIAATLNGTAASEFFTQDVEDLPEFERRASKTQPEPETVIEGEFEEVTDEKPKSKRDLVWDIIEHNGYFDSRVAFDKYVMELLKDGAITKDDSLTRIVEVITYKMNQADEIADEKQDAVQEKLQEAYGKLTDEFESLDALKQWLGIQGIVISRLSAVDTIVGMIRERIAEQAKLAS